MDDTKKTGEAFDWVPLVMGAQTVAHLTSRPPWPLNVQLEANGKLLDALRSDRIESVGYYEDTGQYWLISAMDWMSLRPLISKNRLIPYEPSLRRGLRLGWIVDIEVNVADIRQEFATVELPRAKHPGGRPPNFEWEKIKGEMFRLMNYHDEFTPDDPEWNVQARLEKALLQFCSKTYGREPSMTSLRDYVSPWLQEWRQSRERAVGN